MVSSFRKKNLDKVNSLEKLIDQNIIYEVKTKEQLTNKWFKGSRDRGIH
tara:strand:- start:10432 stop:10578 length:147 start_codon:yes stop_codon:yes gene_type:complete